jgi:hypothetical protein
MEKLVDVYLERFAERSPLDFLDGDLASLRSRHGAIVARRLRAPRVCVSFV